MSGGPDYREMIESMITRKIGEAEDNLIRCERAFRNYTFTQMKEKYGQSGLTCEEVLDGYRRNVADNRGALRYFMEHTH